MEVNGKVWGTTSPIFSRNNVEVHRIVGKEGGKSSVHRHTSKWSAFYVEFGTVAIKVQKNDYDLTDETVLVAGQMITIKPGEFHWFEIIEEGTVAYEIYWMELDPNDIERKNVGSVDPIG